MKLQIKLLLVFLVMVSVAQGQSKPKRAEDTILKLDKRDNPYSDGQTEWLKKNGFNVDAYMWDDDGINNQLAESIRRRGAGQFYSILAGASGILSLQKFISDEEGRLAYLAVSAVSVAISLNKFKKSKRQLHQIEKWRSIPNQVPGDSINLFQDNQTEFSLKSPYKPSKNRFLIKNGFALHSYNWDQDQVNLNLQKAFQTRNAGHVSLWFSVTTFLMGSLHKMASVMVDDRGKANSASAKGNNFYIASGGLLVTSIALNSIAKKKVRKAQQMRRIGQPVDSKVDIDDMY